MNGLNSNLHLIQDNVQHMTTTDFPPRSVSVGSSSSPRHGITKCVIRSSSCEPGFAFFSLVVVIGEACFGIGLLLLTVVTPLGNVAAVVGSRGGLPAAGVM